MGISLKGVSLGYMGVDKSLLLEGSAPGIPYQCPAIAYVIEHPDGRILWETGISAKAAEEWPVEWQQMIDLSTVPPEACLETRLKELALGPDDFRWVVMGHLHLDHAGGLRIFADADAEIVVHEDEYNHVQAMQSDAENFYAKADFAFMDGVKPTTLSGNTTELTRDVRLVSFPGHTPGQMGSYGPPAVGSPIVWDADRWRSSVETVRKVATEHEALIFPGHDTTGIKQFTDRSEARTIEFWPGYEYE
jgi:N-acyl homoserine lactone hydrolase